MAHQKKIPANQNHEARYRFTWKDENDTRAKHWDAQHGNTNYIGTKFPFYNEDLFQRANELANQQVQALHFHDQTLTTETDVYPDGSKIFPGDRGANALAVTS